MKSNELYLQEVYKKYEKSKNSKDKNSFYKMDFNKNQQYHILQIAASFILSLVITFGVVYAGFIAYQNIWKEPKEYTFEEAHNVTEEDIERSLTKDEAINIARDLAEKYNKNFGNVTKCDLNKDADDMTWIIVTDTDFSVDIDGVTGKLIQMSDFSVDDTKIPATASREEAEAVANEIYLSLGYTKGEYVLADLSKNAITDNTNLWQADFCKEYDGIYNYYQDIRITFIPETKDIVILTIFDEDFENNPLVITKEEAVEIAKQKAKSLGKDEDMVKNATAKLDIRKMNAYVYSQEQTAIPKPDGNVTTNISENTTTISTTDDIAVYDTEDIVRKVWVVEIEYKENEYAFTEKDMYFVDCTTGEIIGGDSMK